MGDLPELLTDHPAPLKNPLDVIKGDTTMKSDSEINSIFFNALKEISKAAGSYSKDLLEHASNTIEEMRNLAIEALKSARSI